MGLFGGSKSKSTTNVTSSESTVADQRELSGDGQIVGGKRLGGGEEQRLDHAQRLTALFRRLGLGGRVVIDRDGDGRIGISHGRPPV